MIKIKIGSLVEQDNKIVHLERGVVIVLLSEMYCHEVVICMLTWKRRSADVKSENEST